MLNDDKVEKIWRRLAGSPSTLTAGLLARQDINEPIVHTLDSPCSSTTPHSERVAPQSSVAQPANTWRPFATEVEGFCGGVGGLAEAQIGLATGKCCRERQEPA